MQSLLSHTEFDRTKIYEKLAFRPQPDSYNKDLPWIVQLQIAATNGIQYQDTVGKLDGYPTYNLPVPAVESGLMLDIGTGWGRWLVAGAQKGYIPIGVDLRLEFCETAINTLHAQKKNGYAVVADLKNLPFKSNIFDLVWSFSVIQHTCKERCLACLTHVNRLLTNKGFTYLEFPNKEGFRNRMGPAKINASKEDDYKSWHVRYYSVEEYREMFKAVFGNFDYDVHSFLGIGVLREDLKYVTLKNKIMCAMSLLGSSLAKHNTFLKNRSDSLYLKAFKNKSDISNEVEVTKLFLKAQGENPGNNLNLIPLLQCPVSGGDLILSEDQKSLISLKAGIGYPVVNQIPILISSEASSL